MRMDDGRVVTNFIAQALKNEPITIYGSGEQTRSFCYINDLIDGIIHFMNTPTEVTGPVNLGNPAEFTVAELAQKVIHFTGSTSQIIYYSLPEDDPKRRNPDISLAKSLFGFNPKVTLDEGLQRMLWSLQPAAP